MHAKGRVYCSAECKNILHRERSSKTMAETNKKYCSARMKTNNPMSKPEAREKMANTLKTIGHKPRIQGGNGKPMPEPQRLLSEALGWETEVAVCTPGMKWNCLKIDIASTEFMVGIEVDGGSHYGLERKRQDTEKEEALHSLGWTVLRFKNVEVLQNLESCVKTVMSTILRFKTTTTILQTAS